MVQSRFTSRRSLNPLLGTMWLIGGALWATGEDGKSMPQNETIWLLSEQGILALDGNPVPSGPFDPAPVIAGDVNSNRAAVVVDHREVWTFEAGAWSRAVAAPVKLNCVRWTGEKLLVGTAGARLAWITDDKLDYIAGFDGVPERKLWKTPWGGPPDVRSLAVSPDGTLYVNIHVGWIVRSRDGGQTWQNLREGLDMDVHQVAAHPTKPAVVIAATARGFYYSRDHGDTFAHRGEGMPYLYQRACAGFPDRDAYLVSTSRGPHGQADALLYRSEDAGQTWAQVNGLPDGIEANIDTHQIVITGPRHALVIVENKDLYETRDAGENWRKTGAYPRLFGAMVLPP